MNKHQKKGCWIFQQCLPLCAISPSASLIKKSVFEELGGFDEALPACEDYDYCFRLCSREPVAYASKALIQKYGGHDDQLSRKHWGMDRFRLEAIAKLSICSACGGPMKIIAESRTKASKIRS